MSIGIRLIRNRGKGDNPEQSKNGERPPSQERNAIGGSIDHIAIDTVAIGQLAPLRLNPVRRFLLGLSSFDDG